MPEITIKSDEILQKEIQKTIQEKLSRFVFPCPHCEGEISEEHFDKKQRAFGYINELVRKVLEEQIIPQWGIYKQLILDELEKQKVYEEFPAVQKLKEALKNYEQKITYLQSEERIQNSLTVKKIQEEKKEIENKHWKLLKDFQDKNQELQRQVAEKQEQIQNLLFKQKGHSKGQEFEKWFFEELQKVFDDRDNIIDISKGQQTGTGKRADFLQEVLIEKNKEGEKKVVGKIIYETKNVEKWNNDWITKLENDMRTHRAEYGFIVATCENDRPIRLIDPRKKIYASGDNNNLFVVAKIMRELLITKSNFEEMIKSEEKEQKIKNLEGWVNDTLPKYISSLEEELDHQEKETNSIISKAEKIKASKEKIRKLVLDKIILEIKEIKNS